MAVWLPLIPLFNKDGWAIGRNEQSMECYDCNVTVDDLERADHLFEGVSGKKTYIFWHDSESTVSYTLSSGVEGGQGGFSGRAGMATTVKEGSPLVKMIRKDGESHRCPLCFSKKHPTLFKSVVATLYGRFYIINIADMTLVDPKIGDMSR
jgi:hypothetical protein